MNIITGKKINGLLTGILEESNLSKDPRNFSIERIFSCKGKNLP